MFPVQPVKTHESNSTPDTRTRRRRKLAAISHCVPQSNSGLARPTRAFFPRAVHPPSSPVKVSARARIKKHQSRTAELEGAASLFLSRSQVLDAHIIPQKRSDWGLLVRACKYTAGLYSVYIRPLEPLPARQWGAAAAAAFRPIKRPLKPQRCVYIRAPPSTDFPLLPLLLFTAFAIELPALCRGRESSRSESSGGSVDEHSSAGAAGFSLITEDRVARRLNSCLSAPWRLY